MSRISRRSVRENAPGHWSTTAMRIRQLALRILETTHSNRFVLRSAGGIDMKQTLARSACGKRRNNSPTQPNFDCLIPSSVCAALEDCEVLVSCHCTWHLLQPSSPYFRRINFKWMRFKEITKISLSLSHRAKIEVGNVGYWSTCLPACQLYNSNSSSNLYAKLHS